MPEARAFFTKLTEGWPLWGHFLHRDAESLAAAYLLLCDSEPFYGNGMRVGASVDMAAASVWTRRLVVAASGLHSLHGLSQAESRAIIDGFIKNLPI